MGLDGGFDAERTSLESTLDRATERYALALRQQVAERQRDGGATPFDRTAALALVKAPTFHVGQLRWKGIEVSDEFLRYAARVARGEQLTPYRGQVLARAGVDFPWNAELRGHVDGPTHATEPRVRRRKRGRRLLGWARGAGALVICVLLVGVGAAAMTGGATDESPAWSLRLAEPAHAATPRPSAQDLVPPSAAAPSAAPPSERAAEPKAAPARPAPKPATRRSALVTPRVPAAQPSIEAARTESAVAAPGAMRTQGTRTQAPVDAARTADTRVITVVGSTLLPPLYEVSSAPAASPLLLENPPF